MKTKLEMLCRKAIKEDAPVITDFQMVMARETENLELDRSECEKGVAAVFDRPELGQYYVVEKQGRLIASLLIIPEWSDWRNRMVWWIHSVFVLPEERRSGVFAFMYQTIQEFGEMEGNFRGLRLYVDKTNTKAQSVYQRLGMSNQHYELYEWMKN